MLGFLHSLFYVLPILYIWAEIYHIANKKRLYRRIDTTNIDSKSKYDLVFYFTKVSYLIWISIGLFTHLSVYFWIIVMISLVKYPLLLTRSNFVNGVYDIISQIICIGILILIMTKGLPF